MGYPSIEKPHRFVCVCLFSPLEHASIMVKYLKGVTSSEEGEPILLDPDPAKYWHDICKVPLGPYTRVLL